MLLNTVALRQAAASDWPAVEALLLANKLPTDGAQTHLPTYLLAVSSGEVVGCAGAELYGSVALLRSVAIAPGLKKQGIGRLLVERMLHEARARDIATIYLLTVTPEYFAQYGFTHMKIEDAPHALKASAEFHGACPACAALMALTLHEVPVVDAALPVAGLGAGPVGVAAVAPLDGHSLNIRTATPADAAAVAAIYAPIVRDTTISFETEVPGETEMRARIEKTLAHLPWLVAEDTTGALGGYAYASKHRERSAYQWSVDVTAYVRDDMRRQGVGRALYGRLLQLLAELGYCQAFAGIALPNAGSVGLHEAMGFEAIGVYRNVGFKHGAWRDVGWWQKSLAAPDAPTQPRLFDRT